MIMAMAAIPAVSVRRVVFPRVTDLPPAAVTAATSASLNPPSGPINTAMRRRPEGSIAEDAP